MSNIDNTQDIIDSRDIIERIEELKNELGLADGDYDENGANLRSSFNADPDKADLYAELTTLEKLASEAEASPDWAYGESLIREDYFTDYIEQLIDDCYEMPKELNSGNWPYRHITIDYEAAAEEAKQDYIEVDFDGVTYLIRA